MWTPFFSSWLVAVATTTDFRSVTGLSSQKDSLTRHRETTVQGVKRVRYVASRLRWSWLQIRIKMQEDTILFYTKMHRTRQLSALCTPTIILMHLILVEEICQGGVGFSTIYLATELN